MRRDEYEENLRRMEQQYIQHLEEVKSTLDKLRKNYEKSLKDAGLEMDHKGIVRYTNGPADASIAPTYEAERLAQVRSYEVRTRIADIDGIAQAGIQSVINAYSRIEANKPMPQALENQLREIQEEVKKAVNFIIGQHAGNPNNGSNNGYYR